MLHSFLTKVFLLGAAQLLVLGSINAFVFPAAPTRSAALLDRQVATDGRSPAFVREKTVAPFRGRSHQHVLFMGWGPDPVWSSASVKSNGKACQSGSCVTVTLDVPAETAPEYTVPGQYVQLRLNEDTKPVFLAISGAPDPENASFEFLIKKTDGNEWITAASAGTKVEVSQVLGGGFPMEDNLDGFKYDFPTQNILLFAVGSGIAPIKAAMESGQLKLENTSAGGRTARLYYGVQNPDELCFVDSFGDWEKAGFQVVPVLSQPPDDWEGRTGYIQAALEEDGVPIPRNSGALMCGMKGMTEAVQGVLSDAGVFEGRIMTNF